MENFKIYDTDIIKALECEKYAIFNKFINKENKNYRYFINKFIYSEVENTQLIYKKDLLQYLYTQNTNFNYIDKTLDHTVQILNRFKDFLKENNLKFVKDITTNINNEELPVFAKGKIYVDVINNYAYIVSIKTTKPTLTYKSRVGNRVIDNIELYMLQKIIEKESDFFKKYKKSYPGLFFLRNKHDTDINYYKFDYNHGDNIIINYNNYFSNIVKEKYNNIIKLDNIKNAKNNNKYLCNNCPFWSKCFNDANIKNLTNTNNAFNIKNTTSKVKEDIKEKVEPTATQEQIKAINITKGICRVNAGAGTGKTFIIIKRIVKLLNDGYDPKKLLLITFTNKGAEEMKERLYNTGIEEDIIEQVNITTFNGFGHDIIREKYKEFGYNKKPELISDIEKNKIIIELLKTNPKISGLNYTNPLISFKYTKGAIIRLLEFFDFFQRHNIKSTNDFLENYQFFLLPTEKDLINKKYPFIEYIFDMYIQFKAIIKNKNLIEYHDQINLILYSINNKKNILKQCNYQHIIVDEFQDTDMSQLKIIKFLTTKKDFKSLMVVGDDSQSIFGFRGTTPEIIINFQDYFNDVIDINITQNFRSTKEIVNLANKINELNSERIDKELFSTKTGSKPILYNKSIKDIIDNDIALNYKDRNIAIIARTNYELHNIKLYLNKKNIPAILHTPLIKNPNVLLFKQLIDFIYNPNNNIGIFIFLSLFDNNFINLSSQEKVNYIDKYIYSIVQKYPIGYSYFDHKGNIINTNKEKFKFLEYMIEIIDDKELIYFYKELRNDYHDIEELKEYIDNMFLFNDQRILENNINIDEFVVLSTIHTAKGREFDDVYLKIDKFKNYNNTKSFDEEIRLLFVGVTRAKKNLTIISEEKNIFYNILCSQKFKSYIETK